MKAKLRDIIPSGSQTYIQLLVDQKANYFDKFIMKPCEVEIKPFTKKRSKDANALLWACLGEIAAALRADKWDIYLQMLKRYGRFTYILVKPEAIDEMKKSWRESEIVGQGILQNGQVMVQMLCYFGSSTYDSKEFSVLLDGVISEMKEMGLETPTSEEMQAVIDELERRDGNGQPEKTRQVITG